MKCNQELFAGKLAEMSRQYSRVYRRIRVCQQADHANVCRELQKVKEEYRQNSAMLQNSVEQSRSPAVKELARTQLEYVKKMEALLQDGWVGKCLHSEKSSPVQDQAEASALYAEYAIDYAIQTMRYALAAALTAMDLQMDAEEEKGAS